MKAEPMTKTTPPPTRRLRLAAVTVAAAAIFVGVAVMAFSNSGTTSKAYSASQTAFRLPAMGAKGVVSLGRFAGKPVVVNFFASWCVYCNQELPGFVQVAKATHGRVHFVGVDTSDPGNGLAMAERFGLRQAGFSLASDIGPYPPSQLWSTFGTQGLPVTAFYSPQGKVVYFSPGLLTQSALESKLHSLFGISVHAPDAAGIQTPVIPVIARGAFELLRTHLSDPTFKMIDVATPAEFAAQHIPYTTNIDIASPTAAGRLAALPRSATYVLYSNTGQQSTKAAAAMHGMGFLHVYNVEGGLAAWDADRLPVVP